MWVRVLSLLTMLSAAGAVAGCAAIAGAGVGYGVADEQSEADQGDDDVDLLEDLRDEEDVN